MTGAAGPRPRFSLVSAVHDVERYLPAFMESVERQSVGPDEVEVIAVDDGSTDGSHARLEAWARSSRHRVTVLRQENAGPGAARNAGLRVATGTWVSFPDPDDRLAPGYLRTIERLAARYPDVPVIAARPVLHVEAENRLDPRHPRWRQYRPGNRVVDMEAEPNVFPGSATVSFYRLDRVREAGLEFDPRIRPNFEDGHFAASYVLSLERPVTGLARDAMYLYRKRADQTSSLQRSLSDPRRYTTVLELGYLDVIRRAVERTGAVPEWLQQVLIYELFWYLREDEKIASAAVLDDATRERFHELLPQVLAHVTPAAVARHRVHRIGSVMADVLARVGGPEPWHAAYAVRTRVDHVMELRRIQYRYRGAAPAEELRIDGAAVRPAFGKVRAVRYHGRTLLHERIAWLPRAGQLEVRLDGVPVPVLRRWPRHGREPIAVALGGERIDDRPSPVARAGRGAARWVRHGRRLVRSAIRLFRGEARFPRSRIAGRVLRFLAALPPWATRFRDAWLFQDRVHDADDSGERLFDYVRREREDINAWFVLERGTPDWQRLAAAGERRLLAHGSIAWKLAMLNATWLLSSHADLPVYRPPALAGTGRATWRFGFLQHGVTKDDLSVWLNGRELDLFVVSTDAELASVAADGTSYRFTTRETRNTGLPRFDRLLEKGRAVPDPERDLVIVAPTWRQWLAEPLLPGSQRRRLNPAFRDSDYARAWLGLLAAPEIAAALGRRGWRLGFMPHPNLQPILGELELPPHVEPLSFAGTDVQGLYARTALLVTDYSSVAFNTAYIDRPVVYFQFDRELMLGGAHVGRKGYFEYERDGFGPVVEDLESAVRAVVAAIEHGPRPTPQYQARIDATFPVRDGRACERVIAAVEELSGPFHTSGLAADGGETGF